jgi:hypothetical protein
LAYHQSEPLRVLHVIDSHNRFVRIRSDAITRVMGEQVADQKLFDEVYRRQLHNPCAFWTPYPFPSIAADDPAFVRPIPRNSWGGASRALTVLRTPRWMEHYGKYADFTHDDALDGSAGPLGQFLQQMDPDTREFSRDRGACSPAMLTLFDFVWRLYGCGRPPMVSEWNCVSLRMPSQPPLSGGRLSCAPAARLSTDTRRKIDRQASRNGANGDHNRRQAGTTYRLRAARGHRTGTNRRE